MTTTTRPAERLTVERCEEPEAWNSLVDRCRGPIFARWEWGTVCEACGHDRLYLGVRDGDRLVGGVPLVRVRSILFGDKLVSMPFSERGSVLLDPSAEAAEEGRRLLLDRTRDLADELGVDFVSLRGRHLGDPPSYDHRRRWVTFEVPLADGPGSIWEGLDSSRRGHVRQARDNDLDVRRADSLADLREYYSLHLRTMRGHGSPPHSFEFFERLWREFHDEGRMRVGLVEKDGTTINGILDFPYQGRVYHWGAVADYEFRGLDGGSLLLWKGLAWSAEAGDETFDFGRTREGSGVYMFKKSFGGEKVWLDDYHYFPDGDGELPHPEADRYEPLKRIWRRLPLSLVRAVGPKIRNDISL